MAAQPRRSGLNVIGDALVLTEPLIGCGGWHDCGLYRSPFWAQKQRKGGLHKTASRGVLADAMHSGHVNANECECVWM